MSAISVTPAPPLSRHAAPVRPRTAPGSTPPASTWSRHHAASARQRASMACRRPLRRASSRSRAASRMQRGPVQGRRPQRRGRRAGPVPVQVRDEGPVCAEHGREGGGVAGAPCQTHDERGGENLADRFEQFRGAAGRRARAALAVHGRGQAGGEQPDGRRSHTGRAPRRSRRRRAPVRRRGAGRGQAVVSEPQRAPRVAGEVGEVRGFAGPRRRGPGTPRGAGGNGRRRAAVGKGVKWRTEGKCLDQLVNDGSRGAPVGSEGRSASPDEHGDAVGVAEAFGWGRVRRPVPSSA